MTKIARITRKAARAREMIAAIYHLDLKKVKGDRNSIDAMYTDLQRLGFKWDSDQREWLHPFTIGDRQPSVMTMLIGSPTHSVELAASKLIAAFESMGYTIVETELMINEIEPEASCVKISVLS